MTRKTRPPPKNSRVHSGVHRLYRRSVNFVLRITVGFPVDILSGFNVTLTDSFRYKTFLLTFSGRNRPRIRSLWSAGARVRTVWRNPKRCCRRTCKPSSPGRSWLYVGVGNDYVKTKRRETEKFEASVSGVWTVATGEREQNGSTMTNARERANKTRCPGLVSVAAFDTTVLVNSRRFTTG